MKNINVFGYATFGTPNGFTQSCIHGNQSMEKIIKKFDLKSDAIQLLSPSDRIYSIRKESLQNNILLSYSVYTYAKEKNSNRSGTFIGTSIVFTNEILPENLILNSLHEIHINLKNNNVSADNFVLNINHSKDFNLQKILSKDFDKLEHQTTKFNFQEWENTDKNLVIYIPKFDQNEIQNLFKKSLEIIPKYETLYFIDSKEIAEFVTQKRLFRLIDKNGLEQEIQILQQERKQKRTDAIAKFERNKLQLEEEKNREIENRKKQIEQNQQRQSENQKKIDESESDLTKFESLFRNLFSNISSLLTDLHSGKNLDEINNSYKQLEKEFNDEKRKLGSSSQISSFSNPRSSAQVSPYSNPYEKSYHRDSEEDEKKGSMKVVAIVSLVLNILLIGALAYLLYSIYTDNEKKIADTENIPSLNEGSDFNESDSVLVESKLNPFPNDVAKNQENKVEMLKKFDSTSTMKNVIDIIFERNKSIKEVYQFQKNDYKKLLFERNKNAFDVKNGDTILVKKDLLEEIPSYTKLK